MLTAALIYANGPVHIGHLAGCYLPADIYARYLRLRGEDVCFVSGTDEHGAPITLQAHKTGESPKALVDHYYSQIKASFEGIGISFDIFDRTSSSEHHKFASDFFLDLYKNNCFEHKESEQYYDVENEVFLADRYVQGGCPSCSYTDAYGDQCEKCGSSLNPQELKEPRSVLGGKISLRRSANWYLPLSRWQKDLEHYIAQQKDTWKRSVYGQCQSWLKEGLRSRSMTRHLDWGIPVPIPGAKGQVLYVWFDAPLGYITATKKLYPKNWRPYWQSKETNLVHFIGKDNIVFHCLIFPLMLMVHGEDYIVPTQVPANEFMNLEGKKLSTSRNWAVWLHEYLEDFPEHKDALRYTLCAKMPEQKDSNFTWKELQAHNNNALLADFGNFVHRTLHLVHRYAEGRVPSDAHMSDNSWKIIADARHQMRLLGEAVEKFRFQQGLTHVMNIARIGNEYLSRQEPWKDANKPDILSEKLYTALQIGAILGVASEPFLPFSAKKLQTLLDLSRLSYSWDDVLERRALLPERHKIQPPEPIFVKIEDEMIDKQSEKLNQSLKSSDDTKKPLSAIEIELFSKVEMRVATVIDCQAVPRSKKLLRFTLDDGLRRRIVFSGIAQHYSPAKLVGSQVVFVANLVPRKIMGEVSEGMILSAASGDALCLLKPDEKIDAGAQVG